MARPTKEGLDYFPFDVDFDTNEKTEAIMGEFGAKGTLIFIYLLSAIYRKGYFLQWTELAKNQLANRVDGATGELVQQVVDRLVAYGTFDKGLFNSAEVLSSQRIQQTYLDATKRRKSQKPTLYWINVDNNPTSMGVNVYINAQSKVKESKVNKNKDSQTDAHGVSRQQSIQAWENLWGFPNAIALQDLTEWCTEFGDDLVTYVISYAARRNVQAKAANNYLDRVLTGYRSAGITTVEQAKAEAEQHRQRMETAASQRKANQRPHYGKQPVVEDKPSWEQPDHTAPSKRLTPAEQAALDAKLASLHKPSVQQDTAQPDQATDIFAGLGRADAFDGMHLG
jgi:DnaD/phage-associated family protein